MVVLVGEVGEGLLAELGRSGNASVARAAAAKAAAGQPGGAQPGQTRPGWEAGALAMREAAGRQSSYVIVPDDPLAAVAAAWRAMWEVPGGPGGAAVFEERATEALAAWRDKRFELPDYYLVVAQAGGTGPDLYLGPLRAARQRRVAVAAVGDNGDGPGRAARVLDALRSLQQGPWWPPLDELIDVARRFYAGGLAGAQPAPGSAGGLA
jgi:hypothetical protein